MAVGGRAGKKQKKDSAKRWSRNRARVEKALAKARSQLVKRRRQVEDALALVASLEVRLAKVGGPAVGAPAENPMVTGASSAAPTAPDKSRSSKPAAAKSAAKPATGKRAAVTPAPPESAVSAGAAPKRRSARPRSTGTRAPDA